MPHSKTNSIGDNFKSAGRSQTSWHALSPSEVEQNLGTQIGAGLSREQAEKLFAKHGPNKLPEAKTDALALIFFRQFSSPLIFILFAASAVVYLLGDITDSLIIVFVLVFNAIVGTIQEGRAQNTISALRNFVQSDATVLRDGKEYIIPETEIVPGDIVILHEGEKVPADARVIESQSLAVDEAALTGESHPIHKTTDPIAARQLPVSEERNMVFKGTHIVAGGGRAIVTATGLATIIGRISEKISLIESEIPLKANIRHLSRLIIIVVAGLVSVLFLIGLGAGQSALDMFKVAVTLSVSVIPEGLPIVMTIVLVSGVFRMAKHKALVKRLQAVEALGQARVIAVDKTGTLTKNEMTVKEIFAGGKTFSVGGSGYDPQGEITLDDQEIEPPAHPEIILSGKIAALCANAHLSLLEETNSWKITGDPMEAALLVLAQKIGFHKHALEKEFPRLSEIPFDYKAKYHAVAHREGDKQFIAVTGAPEAIISFSKHILKNGKNEPLGQKEKNLLEEKLLATSRNGLRVIAFASAELPLEKEFKNHDHLPSLSFVGFFGIADSLREEAPEAVARAQNAGIRVVMITGDHKATAASIARTVGIYKESDEIIGGEEMDAMTDKQLDHHLPKTTVFARVTPDHKLRIIQAYKRAGEIVAMTGDGINDAPSLVAADLGVAMGKIGTEVAKEAGDIVLLDDNFGSIVSAIEEGRSIYKTIKKVILYLFSTSLGEVLTIGGALVLSWPLPVLPAQIIWLNFVTDGFLDVALAMEKKEPGLLNKNFEWPKKYLMDKLMVWRMAIMGAVMALGALLVFKAYFATDLVKAVTITMTALAIFQWFNAWNCRSEEKSVFSLNPLSNPYLVGATVIIFCLQLLAIYTQFLQEVLGTVPLTINEWLIAAGAALSIIAAEELRKFISRIYVRHYQFN